MPVVPSQIDGLPVTCIGEWAFSDPDHAVANTICPLPMGEGVRGQLRQARRPRMIVCIFHSLLRTFLRTFY